MGPYSVMWTTGLFKTINVTAWLARSMRLAMFCKACMLPTPMPVASACICRNMLNVITEVPITKKAFAPAPALPCNKLSVGLVITLVCAPSSDQVRNSATETPQTCNVPAIAPPQKLFGLQESILPYYSGLQPSSKTLDVPEQSIL